MFIQAGTETNKMAQEKSPELTIAMFAAGVAHELANPLEGTGIGLALSREIVERSGGELRCENVSDPDLGACFILILP